MSSSSADQSGFHSRGKSVMATHPGNGQGEAHGALVTCFEACADCAQACIVCADACLGEPNVADLVTCIRLNQDCAELCEATGNILSRQVSLDWEIAGAALKACVIACHKCAAECRKHAAHMEHCGECEAACRACQAACESLMSQAADGFEGEWDRPSH
ncbi:MAG: four-helix bundle copper-binding protein [Archangium sp.]|nr:four-helix bundle copper-binding protein [Archangium sp.]